MCVCASPRVRVCLCVWCVRVSERAVSAAAFVCVSGLTCFAATAAAASTRADSASFDDGENCGAQWHKLSCLCVYI